MKEKTMQSLIKIREELRADRLGAMDSGNCVYRSKEGKHCAIGCLLSEELHEQYDGNTATTYEMMTNEYPAVMDEIGLNSLQGCWLQNLHDTAYREKDEAIKSDLLKTFDKELTDLIDGVSTTIARDPYFPNTNRASFFN